MQMTGTESIVTRGRHRRDGANEGAPPRGCLDGTCRAGACRRRKAGGKLRTGGHAGKLLLAALLGVAPPVFAEDCRQAITLFEQSRGATAGEVDRRLTEAVRLCPRHVEALLGLGRVREEQGRLDEAEALYRSAREVDSENPAPHAGLGDVHFAREDYAGAVSYYETFLGSLQSAMRLGGSSLAGEEGRYREKLALARRRAGHPEPALTAAEIARNLTIVVSSTGERRSGTHYEDRTHIDVPIHFDTNSARISPRSTAQIRQIARALGSRALRRTRIRIDGHTDSRGTAAYNRTLSERRAESVKRALVEEHDISGARLGDRRLRRVPARRAERHPGGAGGEPPRHLREPGDTFTISNRSLRLSANRRVTFVNLGTE